MRGRWMLVGALCVSGCGRLEVSPAGMPPRDAGAPMHDAGSSSRPDAPPSPVSDDAGVDPICGQVAAVIRDFDYHTDSDFEVDPDFTTDLVMDTLDSDGKPVY